MSMSSKPRQNESIGPQSIRTPATETGEPSMGNTRREVEIRRRAYEIYLERGEQPGSELDDWLQAERELDGGVLARAS
jgi:hypothetical protein